MKKILVTLLVGIFVISGCSSGDTEEEEVFELNINNWNASTHHYVYNVYEPWKELVESKTDGRVEVNIHHGASIGSAGSVYQDVKGGLYELSLLVSTYFDDTDFFPYTLGSLPFAFDNPKDASEIMTEFADEFIDIEDVVVMNPTSTDPYDIFSTEPINSVSDLKNKKMRVNGKNDIPYVEALGGVPIDMVANEIYEALERDTMDVMFYTPIGGVGNRYFEPAPYITKLAALSVPMIPIMNKDFLEGLPGDLQDMFENEFNQELTDLFTESYATELEESHKVLKEEVSERGEFIELTEEEVAEFREKSLGSWDAWVKEAEKAGYDGEEMLDFFTGKLEEKGLPLPF